MSSIPAPPSQMTNVEELLEKYRSAPFLVLSDFDGTISTEDSNDLLIDSYGLGPVARRPLWDKVRTGEDCFRDAFRVSLESVRDNLEFDEAVAIARKEIKLDPGFLDFHTWCAAQSPPIPLIIVSSGMEPIIRGIFAELIGDKAANELDIISNHVKLSEPGRPKTWEIVYRHPESGFGHDKSRAILPFKELEHRPTIFFCGDGISDMSAAQHADVLFVKNKEGNDLADYCKDKGYPFKLFNDFTTVLQDVRAVITGEKKAEQIASH